MVNQVRKQEIEERIKYQRAIYRFHEVDDPALKEHFAGIIKDYEKKHNIGKKKEDSRQQMLPGFVHMFDGKGLA